jgi:hypothetical protein
MNSNLIDDVMKLSSEEKLKLYYALQEELEEKNILQEDAREILGRLNDIDEGKVKADSEEDHLNFINKFGEDA